ncbi:MAG: thermonuclease family protein [Bacteroidia bacterium]|nr:thermonuclease family protein [Bacteroidia bacterium]
MMLPLFLAAQPHESRVIKVIDGDTFVIEDSSRVRMLGIDAPETRGEDEPFSQEAKAYLTQRLLHQTVTLYPDGISPNKDRWGRLLRYAHLDGQDINLEMIEVGLAGAFRDYKVDRLAMYVAAEEKAKRKGVGMWEEKPQQKKLPDWVWGVGIVMGVACIWLYVRMRSRG